MLWISIFIGFVYIYLGSIIFFKKSNFEFLIITLFILISPIPLLAYTNAWLVKYYYYISYFILISIYLLKFSSKIKYNTNINLIDKKNIFYKSTKYLISKEFKIIILSISITLLLTFNAFPYFWRFESTELLYYTWLNDITNIDYIGPIRIPTAFPYLQAANHLTPGSLLIPFQMFNKDITLYTSYIIKYLIISLTLFKFLNQFFISIFKEKQIKFNKELFVPILIIFTLYSFYFNEIEYSIAISNYPLVILILTFGIIVIKNNYKLYPSSNFNIAIIYISYAFLITKATTFPIIFLSFIIYFFLIGFSQSKKFFNSFNVLHTFLILTMVAINILSWVVPQSNHGSLTLTSPFCAIDIKNPEFIKECLLSISNNPFSGWYIGSFKTDLLKILKIKQPFIEFIFIWFFCLIPSFYAAKLLIKNSNTSINKNIGLYILSYLFSTSLCIILLRESTTFSGAHTAHSYIFAPLFTLFGILITYTMKYETIKFNNIKLLFILTLTIILFIKNLDNSLVNQRNKSLKQAHLINSGEIISMTFKESKYFDKNTCTNNKYMENKFREFLDPQGCAFDTLGELNTALKGVRSTATLNSRFSVLRGWVLYPKK